MPLVLIRSQPGPDAGKLAIEDSKRADFRHLLEPGNEISIEVGGRALRISEAPAEFADERAERAARSAEAEEAARRETDTGRGNPSAGRRHTKAEDTVPAASGKAEFQR